MSTINVDEIKKEREEDRKKERTKRTNRKKGVAERKKERMFTLFSISWSYIVIDWYWMITVGLHIPAEAKRKY